MSSRRNMSIHNVNKFKKLENTEKKLDNVLSTLQRANGNANLNNKDLKIIIGNTYDAMKQATLDVVDCWESNSEDSNEATQQSSPRPAAVPPLPVEPNFVPRQTQSKDYADSRRHNLDVSTDGPGTVTESVISSFEMVTLDDPEEEYFASGPISDRSNDPIPRTETRVEPIAATDSPRGPVISMLLRMGQRLKGFFQWLLDKIKEVAQNVWNKVCDAFTAMFNWLSQLLSPLMGSGSYSKFHAA